MKTLYLVDASSMFFRAYYAVRPLANSKGLPTNALYGFTQMTVKLLNDVKPDYMCYCFDRKEPSFRVEMYPEYKANRGEMPEDLVPQVPYFMKIVEALGIPHISKEKFEADDVIGTLVALGEKEKLKTVIVSGDKDFAQLVNQNVSMYDTMKDVKYDEDGVMKKWGVPPHQILDYLSIIGDSSDNIPGVKGIGPKGAVKLLGEYKSLEEIYKNLDVIKNPGMLKKLEASKEMAFLSKELITIVQDIDLGIKLEDLKLKPIVQSQAVDLLDELEFQTFKRRLFGREVSRPQNDSSIEKEVSDNLEVKNKDHNIKEERVSLFKFKELIPQTCELWALQTDRELGFGLDGKVYQVECEVENIGKALGGKNIFWKGFDLKSLWHLIDVKNPQCFWDQAVAVYLLNPGHKVEVNSSISKYSGVPIPEFPSLSQYYKSQLSLEENLARELGRFELMDVYKKFELPLVPVLYDMEKRGVLIDSSQLELQSHELLGDIENLETEIHEEVGEKFNIASPKQLGSILFEKLKLPVIKKTKTGFSTDSDVLLKLGQDNPICLKIIEYRELSKLKSTYIDALPKLINEKTGRVHTHFNQLVASTGRLSSTNPNLQNIPIRTSRGRAIRKAFISSKGSRILAADYSQIELRVLAHITNDPGLCKAFEKGLDIHKATAAEVFNLPLKEVTEHHRRLAKGINFGLAYGMGVYGLAENLSISRSEAKEIIETYFKKFSKVREYMNDIVEEGKSKGFVRSLFGRRRNLPELKSKNAAMRKFGERAAINAPIQGTASDIVKKAMIDVYNEKKIDALMTMQVHDELVFECDVKKIDINAQKIKKKMENAVKLNVPLTVNVASGKDWEEAH